MITAIVRFGGKTNKAANDDEDDQAMMKVVIANGDAVCRSDRGIADAWNGYLSFLSELLVL